MDLKNDDKAGGDWYLLKVEQVVQFLVNCLYLSSFAPILEPMVLVRLG